MFLYFKELNFVHMYIWPKFAGEIMNCRISILTSKISEQSEP